MGPGKGLALFQTCPEAPAAWLRGWAVACAGVAGTSWNWLCLARGGSSAALTETFAASPSAQAQQADVIHSHTSNSCSVLGSHTTGSSFGSRKDSSACSDIKSLQFVQGTSAAWRVPRKQWFLLRL